MVHRAGMLQYRNSLFPVILIENSMIIMELTLEIIIKIESTIF